MIPSQGGGGPEFDSPLSPLKVTLYALFRAAPAPSHPLYSFLESPLNATVNETPDRSRRLRRSRCYLRRSQGQRPQTVTNLSKEMMYQRLIVRRN